MEYKITGIIPALYIIVKATYSVFLKCFKGFCREMPYIFDFLTYEALYKVKKSSSLLYFMPIAKIAPPKGTQKIVDNRFKRTFSLNSSKIGSIKEMTFTESLKKYSRLR